MKFGGSINVFRKWWLTWRTLPVLSWVKAASYYRLGNYALAAKHYQRGLKIHSAHPAHFCARLDLAYCLFKLDRFEEAEHHLRFVTLHLPQSREAYLRLARLQSWLGQSLEAAWTIRRALRHLPVDSDLAAMFLLAVLDNDGPAYLRDEAAKAVELAARSTNEKHPKLEVARALMQIREGVFQAGRQRLEELCSGEKVTFEALLLFADVLVKEGKIAHARRLLRRAMTVAPDYPRVLSLLAESYLRSGPFYNGEYAKQLATTACQKTNWSSPREMHILAETYYHVGDKISALVIASRAKQAGQRLLGAYRDVKSLDKLIENLSSGTQA